MAAVAAALLQPLQQQVVDALIKSLKDRLRYFFVSDDTHAKMGTPTLSPRCNIPGSESSTLNHKASTLWGL